jgi:flagellar hook assembly protein FlgD
MSNGQRPPACEVTVNVVTATAGGEFAPRNTAAVWVQTLSGKFEKTLSEYGVAMRRSLVHWTSISGSNTVDAVTGATRAAHGPLSTTWDCTDTTETEVPDGAYEVCVTFAEGWCDNTQPACSSSPMQCVVFEKGPAAATVHGQDTANFSGFVVTYR